MNILVVEDEKAKRVTLETDLAEAGYAVCAVDSAHEALAHLKRNEIDVVIADLKLPGMDGMELLRSIKEVVSPSTEVMIITGYGSIPLAVEAMRNGAWDFISKPFDNRQLVPLLKGIEKKRATRDSALEIRSEEEFFGLDQAIVGQSHEMQRVRRLVRTCTGSDVNVLLIGETGTGKDLVGSVIHKQSKHRPFPFIKVSCSAYSDDLLEGELFGNESRSYAETDQRNCGRFELAQHGTVYLDDVEEITLKVQVKLLQVIEEKLCERVGSATPVKCDVRIIAATKIDLAERVEQKTFREDFYYRLKVLEIILPPLRNRIEDIPALAAYHVERISGGKQVEIPDKVMARLKDYHWPGNVRELVYMLERAYILGGGVFSLDQFDFAPKRSYSSQSSRNFKSAIEHAERELLEDALYTSKGNKALAARILDMKVSTFRDKLAKYGLS